MPWTIERSRVSSGLGAANAITMDVMAGLQTQQGLHSVAGEALMEGRSAKMRRQIGPKTE